MGDSSSQKQSQQKDREKESEHSKDQIPASTPWLQNGVQHLHPPTLGLHLPGAKTFRAKQGREEAGEKPCSRKWPRVADGAEEQVKPNPRAQMETSSNPCLPMSFTLIGDGSWEAGPAGSMHVFRFFTSLSHQPPFHLSPYRIKASK